MKVLVNGSFDPPTLGHIALINEAIKLYGEVVVCVMVNEQKTALFTLDERKRMLELCLGGTASVDAYSGMACEYCLANGIDAIVRGFRNADDYAYETEMAKFNKKMCGVDTLLLQLDGLEYVTATKAREGIKDGADISNCVPHTIIDYIASLKEISSKNQVK